MSWLSFSVRIITESYLFQHFLVGILGTIIIVLRVVSKVLVFPVFPRSTLSCTCHFLIHLMFLRLWKLRLTFLVRKQESCFLLSLLCNRLGFPQRSFAQSFTASINISWSCLPVQHESFLCFRKEVVLVLELKVQCSIYRMGRSARLFLTVSIATKSQNGSMSRKKKGL